MTDLLAEVKSALDAGFPPSLERIRALVARCEQEAFDLAHERDSVALLNHTIDALRQRHAQDVEAAFREGRQSMWRHPECSIVPTDAEDDAAWLASKARKKVGI